MQKTTNLQLILDTHIFLWLMNGDKGLSEFSLEKITHFLKGGYLGISVISFWEISMLHSRQRIQLNQPCLNWINQSLKAPGIVPFSLSPEICVESSLLPGEFHGDPADRIIVATARVFGIPLMTRDKKILDYSTQGYLSSLKG